MSRWETTPKMRAWAVRALAVMVASSALALAGHGAKATTSQTENACAGRDARQDSWSDDGIGLTSSLGLAAGRYALPADAVPTKLVVMFHGHGNDSCGWRNHLRAAAAHGAVAVAMDYTGQSDQPTQNYGWRVREGAADSIAAAKYFLAQYPSITNVVAFGISMGGNAAGVAVASPDAVRTDGSPLFDSLVDVEGVNNLTEEYLIVRGIAPVNASGAQAKAEIEEENGGPIESNPQAYAELTNVARAGDMKALKNAVVVQGIDDGLVPTNQSDEMTAALTAVGVPTHEYKVVLRGGAEPGTTLTNNVAPVYNATGQGPYQSPFAGHGWEGSDTHLVIKTGFDQLWALLDGTAVAPGYTVIPGA